MAIRVACIGGGPGGLFFSILLKRARPDIDVVLIERNQPTDAFGFGVVFSDRTLQQIDDADSVMRDALEQHGVHWDSIAVSLKGQTHSFAGNGMAAIHRKVLLRILQEEAAAVGVELRFGTEFSELSELSDFDVVVGADGANSRVRDLLEVDLGQSVETAVAKFIWFGTTYPFERLTFVHQASEHGVFAAHAYPIGQGLSTFIVETDEATWRAAGLDGFDPTTPPGPSDEVSQEYLRTLFAAQIDGYPLVANNSRWANFRTRRTRLWHSGNVVLLGDAVHTAHFSVGAGTKMAMEDAIVLAREIAGMDGDLEAALQRYEAERQPEVARIQDAAGPSLSWWEHFGTYYESLQPLDFAFHFFSRSMDIARMGRRDPELAQTVTAAWRHRHHALPLESDLVVGDTVFAGRRLTLTESDGSTELSDDEDARLVVDAVVTAPDEASGVPAVEIPGTSGPVVIDGGTSLTRTLLAERVRFDLKRIAIVVDDELDDAGAATLLLSGRADAVARRVVAHAAI
jgi:anthraniloyl-CoA monooxygenase